MWCFLYFIVFASAQINQLCLQLLPHQKKKGQDGPEGQGNASDSTTGHQVLASITSADHLHKEVITEAHSIPEERSLKSPSPSCVLPKFPTLSAISAEFPSPTPASPKSAVQRLDDSPESPSLMESPESPPQEHTSAAQGHLPLDRVPAKRLRSTTNNKNPVSWPAAFVNTRPGVAWQTPGLGGGAAIKQETTESPVSPKNPQRNDLVQENNVSDTGQEKRQVQGQVSTEADTTTSEADRTFRVPNPIKTQRKQKRREGDGSPNSQEPEDGTSDSQSDNEANSSRKAAVKLLRIPVDLEAKKRSAAFIVRHELDNSTGMSMAANGLDRGKV